MAPRVLDPLVDPTRVFFFCPFPALNAVFRLPLIHEALRFKQNKKKNCRDCTVAIVPLQFSAVGGGILLGKCFLFVAIILPIYVVI